MTDPRKQRIADWLFKSLANFHSERLTESRVKVIERMEFDFYVSAGNYVYVGDASYMKRSASGSMYIRIWDADCIYVDREIGPCITPPVEAFSSIIKISIEPPERWRPE